MEAPRSVAIHSSRIGGPGTCLPRPIESILSWSLCLSCLTVSAYYHFLSFNSFPFLSILSKPFNWNSMICRNNLKKKSWGKKKKEKEMGMTNKKDKHISYVYYECVCEFISIQLQYFLDALKSVIDLLVGNNTSSSNNYDSNTMVSDMNIVTNDRGKDGNGVFTTDSKTTCSLKVDHTLPFWRCWIPLTTHSRREIEDYSPLERYAQLMKVLTLAYQIYIDDVNQNRKQCNSHSQKKDHSREEDDNNNISNDDAHYDYFTYDLEKLVRIFRSDTICRHLASLIMRPYPSTSTSTSNTFLLLERPDLHLLHTLAQLWPQLLLLHLPPPIQKNHAKNTTSNDNHTPTLNNTTTPSICSNTHNNNFFKSPHFRKNFDYEISLILPAFGESGVHFHQKLLKALHRCTCPHQVEVIVVDAGGCKGNFAKVIGDMETNNYLTYPHHDMKSCTTPPSHTDNTSNGSCVGATISTTTLNKAWGKVRRLEFIEGGGRGPCLNFGAKYATGKILSFCHSDTTLPPNWDTSIRQSLLIKRNHSHDDQDCDDDDHNDNFTNNSTIIHSACAFPFGIDTSYEALQPPTMNPTPIDNTRTQNPNSNRPILTATPTPSIPPGIHAVEFTANIRTRLFSLPYGDQVLSIPTKYFDFLGGFPDQCLMEDYELVSLLRSRSYLLPKLFNSHNDNNNFDNFYLPYSSTSTINTKQQHPTPQQNLRFEKLKIIFGRPALCSPRRWQKYGVLYVTFMNSRFVKAYVNGMGPDELFRLYYGKPPPRRKHVLLSPWEIKLNELIETSLVQTQENK